VHPVLRQQLAQATRATGEIDLDRLLELVGSRYEKVFGDGHCCGYTSFADLMANLGEAVVVVDLAGRIEQFNCRAQEIFGYGEGEVTGCGWETLTVDGECLKALSQGPLPASEEIVAKRVDNEIFPAVVTLSAMAAEDGGHYVALIKDLSELKQAEQELRDSETRFRDLAGAASDWFWETNEHHQLIFISQRIASVLGGQSLRHHRADLRGTVVGMQPRCSGGTSLRSCQSSAVP